jgi:hypothetical protein
MTNKSTNTLHQFINEVLKSYDIGRRSFPKFAHPDATHGLGDVMNHDGEVYVRPEGEDGATFQEIAAELGISIPGARHLDMKARSKLKFVANKHNDDKLDVIILTAVRDYIELLTSSGELDDEEIMLINDNPEHVIDLDGFREFLSDYIRSDTF